MSGFDRYTANTVRAMIVAVALVMRKIILSVKTISRSKIALIKKMVINSMQ